MNKATHAPIMVSAAVKAAYDAMTEDVPYGTKSLYLLAAIEYFAALPVEEQDKLASAAARQQAEQKNK